MEEASLSVLHNGWIYSQQQINDQSCNSPQLGFSFKFFHHPSRRLRFPKVSGSSYNHILDICLKEFSDFMSTNDLDFNDLHPKVTWKESSYNSTLKFPFRIIVGSNSFIQF
jgi:hypothetical protein